MGKVLSVKEAVDFLLQGQIVGLPTETVYGLAADATNEAAIAKVFKAKSRPSFDPLIVHVSTLAAVKEIAVLSEAAEQLFLAFSPGPLTVVLPKKKTIPDLVTSGHPTVAVRIPAHPLMLDLLQSSGLSIAAPSANPFGFASPTTAQHVLDQLGTMISGVVDGGPCSIGIESTIVDMSSNVPKVLRLGGMALEQLERVLGPIATELSSSNPSAPRMQTSNYTPGIPDQLFEAREDLLAAVNVMRSNFEGPASILAVLANHFEQRGSGTLVGISSVAGERGRAKNYIYGSAKAGFTAFLSGLRNRLVRKGVHVITVLPGFVATKMTKEINLPSKLTAQPEEVAIAVLNAVKKKHNIVVFLKKPNIISYYGQY